MFTQCPRCDAIFLLSASQLKAASGDVRCGQCLSVFNALDHLSEDLPSTQEIENLTHDTGEHYKWPENTPDSVTNTDESPTGQTDVKTDSNDIFNDVINEVNRHDIPIEEINRFEAFLATSTLPVEDTAATNDSFSIEHSPSTDDALRTKSALAENALPADNALFPESSTLAEGSTLAESSTLAKGSTPDAMIDTDFVDTFSVDKTSVSTDGTHFGNIDIITSALDTDISIDDEFAELAEFAADQDKLENETQRNNKRDANVESITPPAYVNTPSTATKQQLDTDTADTISPEANSPSEIIPASEKQSSPTNDTQAINIPRLILDDLHAAKAEHLRPSNAPWMIGSLLLMLTLGSQVVYHSRDELTKDANLRPWLIQMCDVLNCTLSQPYDIKQIEIIGRDVRSHPSADNALIVSTSLINHATFVQPFPLLTMVFSNINGTKIAQRRFTPREYLSNTVDLDTGMTPDMPIRIDLELVDPGKDAVNYEFHAEIDPRQTRPLT